MKVYLVEICVPVASPGKRCHRRVFNKKEDAEKYVNNFMEKKHKERFDILPRTEWGDGGNNWHNVISYEDGYFLITIDEIDNKEEE